MPKLTNEFKQIVEEIPVQELKKLLIQTAAKNQELFDILNLRYVSGENAEKELFQETKEKVLGEICLVAGSGIIQINLAKAISKAIKHINHYAKVTKSKSDEAELLLALLEEVFEH